ncbi:hypothetical protein Acsp05_29190 [Actinokineospora sp. NBRC 105648]|nr:hypothetical protein Acsp05_29190 [Actinokineospora sp. NBRC 105648]
MTAAAVVAATATAGVAAAAPGQTDTDDTIAKVVVTSAITLTNLTPDFTLTGLPGATVAQSGIVTFTVTTNNLAGYAVTVQSRTPALAPTASGNTDSIPISALSVRETGTTPYTPLSNTAPVTVHSQSTRSAPTGDNLSNDYQVVIPFVNEDTYTTTLDYVATTL